MLKLNELVQDGAKLTCSTYISKGTETIAGITVPKFGGCGAPAVGLLELSDVQKLNKNRVLPLAALVCKTHHEEHSKTLGA